MNVRAGDLREPRWLEEVSHRTTSAPPADAGRAEPSTLEERALLEAVTALHPAAEARVDGCYAELGGQFLLIPAVLRRLREAGWTGLAATDLQNMGTVRELARALTPIQVAGEARR